MRTIRIVLKLHRFELIVLCGALVVLTLAILYVVARLTALPAELAACRNPLTCTTLQEDHARLKLLSMFLALLGVVLPIFAGVIFGVPLVAREIERGTAALSWTMSPSRHGWFLRRIAILGGTLAAIAILPSMALELLSGAIYPAVDLTHSYVDTEARGPIIAARALAAFGVASLAGAIMGRALPGVLLAIAACAALLVGLQIVDEAWLRADAVPLPDDPFVLDSLIVDVGYVLPDGRVVDWETAWASLDDPNSYPAEAYPERYIGVPAELAPEKRGREIALILASGLAAVGAATVVVDRRRPY